MPVIGIPVEELIRRIGREIDQDELLRVLQEIGCDVEGYELQERIRCASCGWLHEVAASEEPPERCERCQADFTAGPGATHPAPAQEVVRMDLLAVRPDLFDPGGLARALRGILSLETGLPSYKAGPPCLRLRVDPSVRRPSSLRPAIACAVVRGVSLDESLIKILMKLQENLHWALGRDRKHASIGVYDLDSLRLTEGVETSGAPQLEYTTEAPGSYEFVPLGASGTGEEHRMSLRRILEEHPKGIAYARLLSGFDRYPILRTSAGLVLSMPPIINSEQTKVHPGSRNLFIDVTGSGERIVQRTLAILVTSILELDRKATLDSVQIEDGESVHLTPDLTPQETWCDLQNACALTGLDLKLPQLRALLLRMRHGIGEERDSRLKVLIPAYRNDILHEHDLVEDVAIAFGYGNIPRTLVPTQTVGRELPLEARSDCLREVLIGLGLTEIMTLVLTCPEQSDRLLGVPDHPATVLVENPISSEQVQLRVSLLPGILWTLARNRHNPLPQGIFEVGDVTVLDAAAETGAREIRHLAFGLIAPKVGFAELRPLVEAVVREIGWPLDLKAWDPPFLLEGRGAAVRAPGGTTVGMMGEVHPHVLERLGLQNPVVVFEMVQPEGETVRSYESFR